MDKFLVRVSKGIITNSRKDTTRVGYWIPIKEIPRQIAARFGADKLKARPHLAFDIDNRQWRDLVNAKEQDASYCNAVVCMMDDGRYGIALVDF